MTFFALLVTLCVLVAVRASAQSALPGQVVAWTNGDAARGTRYVTRSVEAESLAKELLSKDAPPELVILFTVAPSGDAHTTPCSAHAAVQEAVGGADRTVFKNVYLADGAASLAELVKSVPVAPEQLEKTLSADGALQQLLRDGKVDVLQVPLHQSMDARVAQSVAKTVRALLESDKKVVVAAVDASAAARPSTAGGFATVLDDSSATTTSSANVYGDVLYSPEGAEYAIYYAGKYLYITPDIFTGLLTSIFVFATLFVGISCLGAIQGMSSFYDKLPVVGKEA